MNGLQLASMPADDMLDVLHYYLEEDFRYSSEFEPVYKDNFRKSLYESFYGREYKYVSSDPVSREEKPDRLNGIDLSEEDSLPEPEKINPFNPRSVSVKPYIEPTQLSEGPTPFGDVLDMPLN